MPRIMPLKKEEAQGETKDILEVMEKQFGMIPNLFATIARCPKALKPLLGLYQAISKESSLDPKLREMANLEVSRVNRCRYCLAHHTQMAKMPGIKEEQLKSWEAEKLDEVFSDKEKVVIEYARQVTKDAENVPKESEIINLTLIIGLMNVFNRFNGALGVELEK